MKQMSMTLCVAVCVRAGGHPVMYACTHVNAHVKNCCSPSHSIVQSVSTHPHPECSRSAWAENVTRWLQDHPDLWAQTQLTIWGAEPSRDRCPIEASIYLGGYNEKPPLTSLSKTQEDRKEADFQWINTVLGAQHSGYCGKILNQRLGYIKPVFKKNPHGKKEFFIFPPLISLTWFWALFRKLVIWFEEKTKYLLWTLYHSALGTTWLSYRCVPPHTAGNT